MKFEKIAITLALAALIVAAASKSLGAPTRTTAQKVAKEQTGNKSAKSYKVTKSALRNKKSKSQNRKTVEVAAMPSVKAPLLLNELENSPAPRTEMRTRIEAPAAKSKSKFGGSVDASISRDSNIDPDKTKVKATYYTLEPKLRFENRAWSGSFGASLRQLSDQGQADIYSQNQGTASVSYKAKLTKATTSTTTVSGLYHDEMWPDYLTGTAYTDADVGMPIRHADFTVEQKLGFDFNSVKTEIGGSFTRADYSSLYTDWADELLDRRYFEKDNNQGKGFAKITYGVSSNFDISLRPSISHIRYDDRFGRTSNGQQGGDALPTPKYEHIISELALDTAIKFSGSHITPTFVVGQVSDESAGAEDNSYYAVGLSSELVIDKTTKLTLTPNVMYKKIGYDNWTYQTDDPATIKRVDAETSAGIRMSLMLAKNFGIGAGYSIVREKSTRQVTEDNYRQEVVSSTLTFTF